MQETTNRLHKVLGNLRMSCEALSDGSDGQLLARFVSGQDEAAFAMLVRRHGPMVLGVCRRVLRHAQDAEDVFQATFLLLARKAGSIRRREAVGSWLYQTAYRLAQKMRLRAQQQHALDEMAGSPSAADTEAEVSWREVR